MTIILSTIKNLLSRQNFWRYLALTLIILAFILFVFQLGRWVGFRQASFSYRLGDNYYRAFDGRGRGGLMPPFGNLPSGHGATGRIVKIGGDSFLVSTPDNLEKMILVNEKTVIRHLRDNLEMSDLQVDDLVVILGTPNEEAQIEAKLIRLLPPPPNPFTYPANSSQD